MSDPEADRGEETPPAEPPDIVLRLRLAASFLTVLPVGPAKPASPEAVAESFAFFPIVGFILGLALAATDRVLVVFFPRPLLSALTIAVWAIVTGAVHLDGLADTADALGARGDRARALEILRDSRIGSFGAVALFSLLLVKWLGLAALPAAARRRALFLAPGLARWAMVAVSYRLDYLRDSGAGSTVLTADARQNLVIASATALLGLAIAMSRRGLAAAALTIAVVFALRLFYQRWLGGVTGDLIGAAGEIVETAVLMAFAMRII